MRSYVDGMLRYFEFGGRSSRRQYWLFWLISSVLIVGAAFGDYYFYRAWPTRYDEIGALTAFASIVHIIPGLSVTVRRLHDIDRSGCWYFIQMIPLIGTLIFLFWMICPSSGVHNRFGADPRDDMASNGQSRSTIPRQIRMGSQVARPAFTPDAGSGQRFI